MKRLLAILLFIFGCGSASGGGPEVPMYAFHCRHEAILCAIAIEPHCGPLPEIHFGITEDGVTPHAEAYCDGLGYVRLIGTRTVGVYPTPGVPMRVTKIYSVNEFLFYVFGWTLEKE